MAANVIDHLGDARVAPRCGHGRSEGHPIGCPVVGLYAVLVSKKFAVL